MEPAVPEREAEGLHGKVPHFRRHAGPESAADRHLREDGERGPQGLPAGGAAAVPREYKAAERGGTLSSGEATRRDKTQHQVAGRLQWYVYLLSRRHNSNKTTPSVYDLKS